WQNSRTVLSAASTRSRIPPDPFGARTPKYFYSNVNPLKKIIVLITSLLASLKRHSLTGGEMLWNHPVRPRLQYLAIDYSHSFIRFSGPTNATPRHPIP